MSNTNYLGAPEIDHQVLFYPVTNHSFDTVSYEENADGYFLTTRAMVWFWNHHLQNDINGANPRASPLRATESVLSELPPATLFDSLRDEQFAYADALEEAGVSVDHTHYDDMIHDFANMRQLSDPFEGIEKTNDVLERAGEALRNTFK